VRSEAALSDAIERVVGFYREAVGRDHVSAIDESRASAEYLRGLAPRIKQGEALGCRLAEATEEAERWRKRAEACREELERERRENAKRLAALESNAASQVERVRALESERDRAYGTLTWRLRERVLESRTGRGLRRMIERFR
jgi:predicted  nucleic acid-binding Zn-ribbon protein